MMTPNKPFVRFSVWAALTLSVVWAMPAGAVGILDTVNNATAAATGGWMAKSLDLAKTLFFGLAGLEFAWSAIQLTLKKSELTDIAVSTIFKVMNLAFFSMILIKAPEWIPAIMDSFKQAGATVSGTPILTPSEVFSRGVDLAGDLIDKGMQINAAQNGGIGNMVMSAGTSTGAYLLAAIVIGLSGLLVILGFAVVAIQLFVALVESYIVIGGGALMLGFLGSRWTSNFGEKYFSYAVSVGIKLFTLYLLVGMGDTFFQALQDNLNTIVQGGNEVGFADWLGMGGASAVYGGLGYMVPGIASSMLNGAAALSMSNLGSAGSAIAAAPVAGALAGGAALTQAGGYGASLMNLAKTKNAAGAIGGVPLGGDGFSGGIGGGNKPGTGGSSLPGPTGKRSSSGGVAAPAGNGFASSPAGAGPEPRNMTGGQTASSDQDQRAFDLAHGKGTGSGATLSDKLFDKAKEMQYQSERRTPGLVHDGNHGSGIAVRIGHHEN